MNKPKMKINNRTISLIDEENNSSLKTLNLEVSSSHRLSQMEFQNDFLKEFDNSFARYCGLNKEQYENIYIKSNYTPKIDNFGNIKINIKNIIKVLNEFPTEDKMNNKKLIKFKKILKDPSIFFFFKKSEEKNAEFYLKLESDIDKDINKLENLLIEKMKTSGVKLNIEEKKYGEVPKINIKEIEQNISKYELELQKSGNKELFNNLLGNYEQAIVYYSAINDKQYVTYSTRVKELLKNEKYAKYLS